MTADDYEPAILISPAVDPNGLHAIEFQLELRMMAVLEEEAHRFFRDVEIKRNKVQVFEFGHKMEIEISLFKLIAKRQKR